MSDSRRLKQLLLLSVAAAIITISLKTTAWLLTGSVGLLSDAAESLINLAAALIAFGAVHWASLPPDQEHTYGHAKAEYLSAGIEGGLICVAAATIAIAALHRLVHPEPITDVGVGLAVSALASLVNLSVGLLLVRRGRRYRSITVEADGKHLLTDVWTSVGVIVGVALVWITGWERLDPIVALAVALNIVVTGAFLIRRSTGGLMDRALDSSARATIDGVLADFERRGAHFHAIRTRRAGQRSFVSMHILVPGTWTVSQGHDLAEEIEATVRHLLPGTSVFTHIEPAEDPRSFDDTTLDRDISV